jgi:hypothetical protein
LEQKATMVEALYRALNPTASLKKYCPTPGYQYKGTCTAFACAYAARTIIEARYQGWTDKTVISNAVFSPGFAYKVTEPDRPHCDGSLPSQVLGNMQKYGVPKKKDFPEECGAAYPNATAFNKAAAYKIAGYVKLFDSEANAKTKVQMVKKSLAEDNPVVIAMICPNSFDNAKWVWKPTESPHSTVEGRQHGRHALCVVGYDDNQAGGAFEILNSWGTGWGNQGFIWIKYTDFADFVYQGFEVLPSLTPKPIPEPIALQAMVDFVEMNGTPMNVSLQDGIYRFQNAYASGTRFRILLQNDKPCYVYAFGTDGSGAFFPIFPYTASGSASMTYTTNKVAIPSETKHIRLDKQQGKDLFCLIYSKYPLNIAEIKQNLAGEGAVFRQQLSHLLKDKLMKPENVVKTPHKIEFRAKSADKSVVILFAELQHR